MAMRASQNCLKKSQVKKSFNLQFRTGSKPYSSHFEFLDDLLVNRIQLESIGCFQQCDFAFVREVTALLCAAMRAGLSERAVKGEETSAHFTVRGDFRSDGSDLRATSQFARLCC